MLGLTTRLATGPGSQSLPRGRPTPKVPVVGPLGARADPILPLVSQAGYRQRQALSPLPAPWSPPLHPAHKLGGGMAPEVQGRCEPTGVCPDQAETPGRTDLLGAPWY